LRIGRHRGARFDQANVVLQRRCRLDRPLHLELEGAERQPGCRPVRIALRHLLELLARIGIALRAGEAAHVQQAQAGVVRLGLQITLDDRFGGRRAGQHFERKERRALAGRIGFVGAASVFERSVRIQRGEPAASERGAGGASRLRGVEIRLQRLAEQFRPSHVGRWPGRRAEAATPSRPAAAAPG
jgi:hypothetical protein